MAKEVVVGSLGVLYGTGDTGESLNSALLADPMLGPVTAFALMAFVLLYLPCLAALAVIRKETGSWRWTGFSVIYGLVVAYGVAFLIAYLGPIIIREI